MLRNSRTRWSPVVPAAHRRRSAIADRNVSQYAFPPSNSMFIHAFPPAEPATVSFSPRMAGGFAPPQWRHGTTTINPAPISPVAGGTLAGR